MGPTNRGFHISLLKSDEIRDLDAIDMSYAATFGYVYQQSERGDAVHFTLTAQTFDPPFERIYEWDWREIDDFVTRVRSGNVWVARDERPSGPPVGLLELRESDWNTSCWIQSLYVDRSRRREGIGRLLLQEAFRRAHADRLRAVFVETQVSNGPAIHFYRSQGFAVCGVNDHLYSNDDVRCGEVALFMVRREPFPLASPRQ